MKLNKLKEIIKLVEQSEIEELEIKGLFRSVKVTKKRPLHTAAQPVIEEKVKVKEVSPSATYIKAPMVGSFYRSPTPDAPAYVEVGDRVIPGKIVCIIEAMKVMNEIESDVSGIIKEVLVKNESPVEYGQPLFLVEPD